MIDREKIMLLGAGELGKEVVIEAQRLGFMTVAVDRYADAPGMQVAHRCHVIDMLDKAELLRVIELEKPDRIVPEIEAIATDVLLEVEATGINVVPTARATRLTMDREGIRRLAGEHLGLPVAGYKFADSLAELEVAVQEIGTPCFIKPVMSSSGKGQSVCRDIENIADNWEIALKGSRGKSSRVIVEEFIEFDSEITLLTVRASNGTIFCPPIGHIQKDGDYVESWQPHQMSDWQIKESQRIAKIVTDELGGWGLFGVELFLSNDKVWFSEVSPRPHDTGMVTLASQDLSEFALHVRAIMGYPVNEVQLLRPAASSVLKVGKNTFITEQEIEQLNKIGFRVTGVADALAVEQSQVRIFGKPDLRLDRRMGVALATADTVEEARARAELAASKLAIGGES